MNAYHSMRLDDLGERKYAKGETLTAKEQRELNTLEAEARNEEENKPRSWAYGGDMLDVF